MPNDERKPSEDDELDKALDDVFEDADAEQMDPRAQVTITEEDIDRAKRLGTSAVEEALRRQDHVLDVRVTDAGLLVTFTDGSKTVVGWSQA